MPYDRERVWQLESQLREARQKVRMRKAKQMAAKLRLKLSKGSASSATGGNTHLRRAAVSLAVELQHDVVGQQSDLDATAQAERDHGLTQLADPMPTRDFMHFTAIV
jgi:hypothetical protein